GCLRWRPAPASCRRRRGRGPTHVCSRGSSCWGEWGRRWGSRSTSGPCGREYGPWAARSARRAARSSDELLRRAYAERTTRPLTTIAAFLNQSLHELLDQRLRQLACALVAAGDAGQGAAVPLQPQRAARLLVHLGEASKPR